MMYYGEIKWKFVYHFLKKSVKFIFGSVFPGLKKIQVSGFFFKI